MSQTYLEQIKVGNGLIEQIQHPPYFFKESMTKKEVFEASMQLNKDFYKEYPYAIKWDYEKFIREILDYYD